jgi:sec-independent protein translocase protein TatA
MFGNLFSGWHIVILIALVVLLFGATKLPALAKSLGESVRILRKETKTTHDTEAQNTEAQNTEAQNTDEPKGEASGAEPPASDPPQRD